MSMLSLNKPLVIFEMANNHMGSVQHGLMVIKKYAEMISDYPFDFAFKFQFRQLETFIHPDYQARTDLKNVKRFSETTLSKDEFHQMFELVKHCGMQVIVTPFDEASVDVAVNMNVDALKVASCSLTDWPLLEKIVLPDSTTIVSTAGASLPQIDQVVSFFQHRDRNIALMHCVGEYPTATDHLQLNQIALLQKRYPTIPIGYSTHEHPDNVRAVSIALGLGAKILEKHVAVETEQFKKNDYSVTPGQAREWLDRASEAYQMLGEEQERHSISDKEAKDLRQFQRGVFLKHSVPQGHILGDADVFFAFPCIPDQLLANDWSKYMTYETNRPLEENVSLMKEDVRNTSKREAVYQICQEVKSLLKQAGIVYPGGVELEISHHYGIQKFNETGIAMLTVVNREYCKKIIIVLPGQNHPEQLHKRKEETFHVLFGELQLALDGSPSELQAGETVVIEPGTRHAFSTTTGCVLEEISTSHYQDDSYYTDPVIMENLERKTILKYWFE